MFIPILQMRKMRFGNLPKVTQKLSGGNAIHIPAAHLQKPRHSPTSQIVAVCHSLLL